ncbi:MAG: tetratricopeptide repeat protein [Lentisphaerota bacterium]
MLKKTIFVGIGAFFAINLWADFTADFQAAVKLYNEQKNTEAQVSFAKLAEVAPSPKEKAESMAYAALCLNRQKKYDDAIGLANKIEIKPVSINCRMDIMFENNRSKELVDAFKNEDISAWPDYCIHNGYYKRGMAYRSCGDAANAAKDLEKAVESAKTDERKMISLSDLGDVCRTLKDDQKALDAYQKASAMSGWKGFYAHYNAVINGADILSRQGKYDEALAELQKIDLPKAEGYWKFQSLKAYGSFYELQDKKDEALAKYKEALGVEKLSEKVPAVFVVELNKKISALENK